jgi:hypothetical protein
MKLYSGNGTVHPAAANDIDFKTRVARGSVCNGLFCISHFGYIRRNSFRYPSNSFFQSA